MSERQNGHIVGCAYDIKYRGHTVQYVPTHNRERGKGLTVPPCICADECSDDECPDHGSQVFNCITGWGPRPDPHPPTGGPMTPAPTPEAVFARMPPFADTANTPGRFQNGPDGAISGNPTPSPTPEEST